MLLDNLKIIAKENLVRDGFLAPVFCLLRDEHFLMEPTPMSAIDHMVKRAGVTENLNLEDIKTRDVFYIGGMAKLIGANRVIMIWDAAFRTVSDPQAAKEAEENSSLEAPLSYPKSMRTECIIINEVLLPSGKDQTIMVPYKGGEGEPVEFLPHPTLPEGAEYKSRFTDIILEGYNRVQK